MSDDTAEAIDDALTSWGEDELMAALESLLFVSNEPVSSVILAEAVNGTTQEVEAALASLKDYYDNNLRGFVLRHVGGGWQFATKPEHFELLSRWAIEGQQNRLSQAALETLAVIAYLQPVSRSRVSGVRGVNVDGVVRTLLSRDLVTEEGNDDQTGAATLRTTEYFLSRLGLNDVHDLPDLAPYLPEATELEAELTHLANTEPASHSAGASDNE